MKSLPVLFLLLIALGATAHAAVVNVSVTDGAGKPLPQAVAVLEPVSGKLPVKPMAGIEVSQSKRQFQPAFTVVTVGTPVTFPNFDTVRHHVYSFSPNKTFELKLYAGVPNVPVVFDKPGMAVLGCNIHDSMAAWVLVVDSPLHARSGADGKARLAAVPPGAYRLRVWHASLPVGAPAHDQALKIDTAPAQVALQLASAQP